MKERKNTKIATTTPEKYKLNELEENRKKTIRKKSNKKYNGTEQ